MQPCSKEINCLLAQWGADEIKSAPLRGENIKIDNMNDQLSSLLANWEPEVPELPAFRHNVWQRIETSRARPKSGFALWIESFLVTISRPRVAIAAACAAVVLGVSIGGGLSVKKESGASAYLRSVNPYAQVAIKS